MRAHCINLIIDNVIDNNKDLKGLAAYLLLTGSTPLLEMSEEDLIEEVLLLYPSGMPVYDQECIEIYIKKFIPKKDWFNLTLEIY